MAQYGGEQYMKQEGHQTDEHAQNQLHSTKTGDRGHGCKEGKEGVVEKIKEKLPGSDHCADEHMTHDKTTGQNVGHTGTNMGTGGGHGCKEGKQGVVETIKEKLPGTNMGKGGGHGCEEGKQGVVEKIKEKLPGADHGGEYGNVGEEGHEKKGFGGKIKDKLPGEGNK